MAVYSYAYVPWIKSNQKKIETDELPVRVLVAEGNNVGVEAHPKLAATLNIREDRLLR